MSPKDTRVKLCHGLSTWDKKLGLVTATVHVKTEYGRHAFRTLWYGKGQWQTITTDNYFRSNLPRPNKLSPVLKLSPSSLLAILHLFAFSQKCLKDFPSFFFATIPQSSDRLRFKIPHNIPPQALRWFLFNTCIPLPPNPILCLTMRTKQIFFI